MEGLQSSKCCLSGGPSSCSESFCGSPTSEIPKYQQCKASLLRANSFPHSILCETVETVSTIQLTNLSPFERLLVTAKGDLQRIISSWCYETVNVNVKYYSLVENQSTDIEKRYKREVGLTCRGRQFCVAKSEVILSDKVLIDALATNEVGIGQLFRQFDLLPKFELKSIERPTGSKSFSRIYTLTASGIKCIIEEIFDGTEINWLEKIVISEVIQQQNLESEARLKTSGNDANIVPGTQTRSVTLEYGSSEFTPFERVLLSAYDNAPRLVSSYLNAPVETAVHYSGKVQNTSNQYLRVIKLKCLDKYFCVAKCHFTVSDEELESLIKKGTYDINEVFSNYRGGCLPKFMLITAMKIKKVREIRELLKSEDSPDFEFSGKHASLDSLYRKYTLSTSFAQVSIQEVFEPWISEFVQ